MKKRNKPKFSVMNYGFMKSVKKRWRRPRGVDNKKRIKKKFAGALPKIGYRNAKEVRFTHPRGKKEMLILNIFDLNAAKDGNMLVRISAKIGGKKKIQIMEKAKLLGLAVLNPGSSNPSNTKTDIKKTEVKKTENKLTNKLTK